MINKNKLLLAITVIVLFFGLVSCVSYSKIDILSANLKQIQLKSSSELVLKAHLSVENNNNVEVYLSKMSGKLYRENKEFAVYDLLNASFAKPNDRTELELEFLVKLTNPLALLSMGLDLKSWDTRNILVDIRAELKQKKGSPKVFTRKKIQLDKLINYF